MINYNERVRNRGDEMSNVTNEEKKETKMRIQKAALEEFSQKGIQKASVREIAKKAGVGASTLYGYYSSKSILFIETILPTIETRDTLNIKLDKIDVEKLKFEEIVTILTDAVFSLPSTILEMDEKIIKEFHIVLFSIASSVEIKHKMENFMEKEMKVIITRFVKRLMDKEVIKIEIDASELSRFILNLMRAIFMEYVIIGDISREDCYLKLKNMIRMTLIGKI